MKVNHLKTQLLCISANQVSEVSSYIKSAGVKIASGNELKILGFQFGNRPTVRAHVDYMLKKARKKIWALRNVRRAGMNCADMLKIFNTCIRPTLEYVAPTYHPMLTKEMAEEIENMLLGFCCSKKRMKRTFFLALLKKSDVKAAQILIECLPSLARPVNFLFLFFFLHLVSLLLSLLSLKLMFVSGTIFLPSSD